MEKTKKAKDLLAALGMGALVIATITACASADDVSPSSSPAASASAAPTSSPVSGAMSAVDPGAPHDPEDMQNWADGVTANLAGVTTYAGITTHVGPDSSTRMTNSFEELPPGSYSYWFGCRGDGQVRFTIESAGEEAVSLDGTCSGLQGGDLVTTGTGIEFGTVSMDAPADVVIRITDRLPG